MKWGFLLLLSTCMAGEIRAEDKRPNVLFISVDDLRPELAAYGRSHMVTPHIDRLANEGVLFEKAYCNYPVCGASRASIMTGLRPTPTRFLSYKTRADEDAAGILDLAGAFKQAGYRTVSNGKISHNPDDNAASWDEIYRPKEYAQYFKEVNLKIVEERGGEAANAVAYPYEAADMPDDAYQGGKVANKAIEELKRAKASGKPAFITAGFTKPHLPFNCPQKYWDLYPEETIAFPDNYFVPENAPEQSIFYSIELGSYYGIPPEGRVPDLVALNMIRGYRACVSFSDAMIGRIFAAMDEMDLWENTIVVLWGDHGFQLAEHTLWCKHSNYNTSLQVPLIVAAPGKSKGEPSAALVEYVDLYPTLCDLANIEKPVHLEGDSLTPLLDTPSMDWKKAVFARYARGNGESIRTDRYLYTEWYAKGEMTDRMLYDHAVDPDENVNISEKPENAALVAELSRQLRAGWTAHRMEQ